MGDILAAEAAKLGDILAAKAAQTGVKNGNRRLADEGRLVILNN